MTQHIITKSREKEINPKENKDRVQTRAVGCDNERQGQKLQYKKRPQKAEMQPQTEMDVGQSCWASKSQTEQFETRESDFVPITRVRAAIRPSPKNFAFSTVPGSPTSS